MSNIKRFYDFQLNENNENNITLIRGVGDNETGNVDLFGRGLYLTDDMEVAKFYGDKIESYTVPNNFYDTRKNFTPKELDTFLRTIDKVLKTDLGLKVLRMLIDFNEGTIPDNTDYIGLSWTFNSDIKFQELLNKNKLNKNKFNSYANDCTAMNLALSDMGYIGLIYNTDEIEDLEVIGLGDRNAYLVFNFENITKNS